MYSDGISEVKGTVGQMKKSGKLWIVILGAAIGLGLLVLGSFDLPFGKKTEQQAPTVNSEQSELQAYRQELMQSRLPERMSSSRDESLSRILHPGSS